VSYCRWSTDDFQCDLYVWEDASGGWRVAVAARRMVFDEPLPPLVPTGSVDFVERCIARYQLVSTLPYHHEDLDLPHAGETFEEPTASAAADRVAALRALGYRCPDSVEPTLRAEAALEEA
jgi:hypothetical protein